MKFNKDEIKEIYKKILIIVSGIVFYYLLFNFNLVMSSFDKLLLIFRPIIFGFVIAFVANMIMIQYEKFFKYIFKKSTPIMRLISMILAFITLFGLAIFMFSVVIPEFVKSVINLMYQLPGLIQQSITSLQSSKWFENIGVNMEKMTQSLKIDNLINRSLEIIRTQGATVFNGTVNIVGQIFSSFFEGFLAISLSVYILSGKDKLARNSKQLYYSILPEKFADSLLKTIKLLYKNFYNFFVGQFLEALFLGTMVFIGVTIIGGPYALILGMTSGLLNLIPYVGAVTGAIIATILITITDPTKGLIFLIYIVILQQIDGNYIYPNLVGSKMGIPPFWILISITLGGAIMGLVGMVIFVPIVATIYVLARDFSKDKLKQKNIEIDNK